MEFLADSLAARDTLHEAQENFERVFRQTQPTLSIGPSEIVDSQSLPASPYSNSILSFIKEVYPN